MFNKAMKQSGEVLVLHLFLVLYNMSKVLYNMSKVYAQCTLRFGS